MENEQVENMNVCRQYRLKRCPSHMKCVLLNRYEQHALQTKQYYAYKKTPEHAELYAYAINDRILTPVKDEDYVYP